MTVDWLIFIFNAYKHLGVNASYLILHPPFRLVVKNKQTSECPLLPVTFTLSAQAFCSIRQRRNRDEI